MEATEILKETGLKMDHAVESLRTELASVRAGRANPALLEKSKLKPMEHTHP